MPSHGIAEFCLIAEIGMLTANLDEQGPIHIPVACDWAGAINKLKIAKNQKRDGPTDRPTHRRTDATKIESTFNTGAMFVQIILV